MPFSRAINLSSLVRSAIKTTFKTSTTGPTSSAVEDATLKHFVSSIDTASPSTSTTTTTTTTSEIILKRLKKSPKGASRSKKSAPKPKPAPKFELPSLNLDTPSSSDDSKKLLSREISSILCGGTDLNSVSSPDSQWNNDEKYLDKVLDIPWILSTSHNNISLRRKELSRDRKQKWVFRNTQDPRFGKLVRMCAHKLGTDATLQVFSKLGRETGVKEYNALIGLCLDEARKSVDDEVSRQQLQKAFQHIVSMREQGFQLEEETYGPFLMYLIDMGMIEEFQFFYGVIKDENPCSLSRLGYYEMLLWIRVNNEEKIEELCSCIANDDGGDRFNLQESYLLALCDGGRTKELSQLLEIIDITKVSSVDYVASIFKSLGKQLLESFAEKFISACKTCDHGAENLSHFIFTYIINMPNLSVEDVILKFKEVHAKLDVTPSSLSL
ncbi:hypothetical protein L1049_001289 [Liquidambar formosana]|uniref:Pentatricopeptide repeat-containing protein n=1 Tax=Liquidambar formosana TaxID=63359 RepID=A0AAP0NE01_LIQFO